MPGVTAAAWESFQIDDTAGQDLDEELLQSWRRSRWSGVNPEHVKFQVQDVPGESAFLRAAVPVMLRTTEQLSNSETCLALADAQGICVWRWVSDTVLDRQLELGHLMVGVDWSEESVGTNGVGTALETHRPATVLGPAHYARAMHEWACIAAPIPHPVTRRTVGAVNITCRLEDANPFLQIAVRALAHNVQSELQSAASLSQKKLLDAYASRRTRTLAPLLAVNDRIVISDDLTFDHATLWRHVSNAALGAQHIEIGAGVLARLWPVSPATIQDGVVLEVVSPAGRTAAPAAALLTDPPAPTSPLAPRLSPLQAAERSIIVAALARNDGNKLRTAEDLSISRRSLYDKLHRYHLRG